MISKFLKNKKYTIILILVILMILVYAGVKWYEARMRLVDQGLASPNFPYREYSILDLARQGKVTDYVPELEEAIKNLPTRTTPEETFDIYIQALKDGDIEKAAGCMREEAQDRVRQDLYKLREKGELKGEVEYLEKAKSAISWDTKKTEKSSMGRLEVFYDYQYYITDLQIVEKIERNTNGQIHRDKNGGISMDYTINFIKDLYGDWKIDQFY